MPIPMVDIRRTEVLRPDKLPAGLDALAHHAQGRWRSRRRFQRECWALAGRIEVTAEALREVSDADLHQQVATQRTAVRRSGARNSEAAEESLALVAELAARTLGLRPYRVQLMAALGLVRGRLVEMATGEGKTLSIALAAAVSGWAGRPVHVITANDYLASRDADGLRRFFAACRLSVAAVTGALEAPERREAYRADIVYTTSKELVADFLRDRLVLGLMADAGRRTVQRLLRGGATDERVVLRGLHTAIVDEADNQLIDEAVTPLIISRPQESSSLLTVCRRADRVAASLLVGEDYEIDYRFKEVQLLDAGRARIAQACAEETAGCFNQPVWMNILVVQALQARHFFLRDKQYVIVDGKIVIVDESTGRLMPGRAWRLGLHQAVEAKEGVELTPPNESLARLSFQRFFRLFRRLSGITGTAAEASGEFWRIYGLPYLAIPTHRPNQRVDLPTRYFATSTQKWAAVVDEIVRLHAEERPVLIGTRSVAASEHLGRLLEARGLSYNLLNAVRHREEAAIIYRAGESRAVTVATNMAGRGTDIRLGPGVAERGGLHVILTEFHESTRIDRQLQGRAGRQGDPGSTRTFASLEDDLPERFLPRIARRTLAQAFARGGLVAERLAAWALQRTQRATERHAYRQRRLVMEQDQQLAEALIPGQSIDQV
ncbi:MAG TPA: DEAD/DEAH box helicase [Opitutaceae bacterium]